MAEELRVNDASKQDKLQIPRYLVHIEVWDNARQKHVVLEQYNTNSLPTAENDMRAAAGKLEKLDRAGAA